MVRCWPQLLSLQSLVLLLLPQQTTLVGRICAHEISNAKQQITWNKFRASADRILKKSHHGFTLQIFYYLDAYVRGSSVVIRSTLFNVFCRTRSRNNDNAGSAYDSITVRCASCDHHQLAAACSCMQAEGRCQCYLQICSTTIWFTSN
jgi:hypothetical protein